MSVRDDAIEALKNLPKDTSPEDIEYHVYVVTTLSRRLENPGKEFTPEEARERLKRWLD